MANSNLAIRVIPCLDLKDGRVVKGVKFANLRDAGDPVELVKRYESEGADEIVLLDISATIEGRSAHEAVICQVREAIGLAVTTGGGVKSVEDAGRLLAAGADKVSVNTAAVESPEIITEIATKYGSQCAVLAIDGIRCADGSWEVVSHSGKKRTGIDLVAWAKQGVALGAGEILLTSFDRDGTGEGYDLELLKCVTAAVSVPVIASGGAKNSQHLVEAIRAGAHAVLAASIFHDAVFTVREVKDQLRQNGIRVRA